MNAKAICGVVVASIIVILIIVVAALASRKEDDREEVPIGPIDGSGNRVDVHQLNSRDYSLLHLEFASKAQFGLIFAVFLLFLLSCAGSVVHHKKNVLPMALKLADRLRGVERVLRNRGYMQLKTKKKKRKGKKNQRRMESSSSEEDDGDLEEVKAEA